MNSQPRTKKHLGFTLIEVLVVATIIGILTSIGFVSYQSTQKSSRDGKRKADLEQVRGALEIYRSDNNAYPAGLSTLTPNYIQPLPTDPKGYSYYYNRLTTTTYNLCAYLEGGGTDNCGLNCGTAPGNCNYKLANP